MLILTILAVAAVVGFLSAILAGRPSHLTLTSRLRLLDLTGDAGEIALLDRTSSLKNDLRDTLKAARDLAAKAETEGREFSEEERTQVKDLIERAGQLKSQIADREGDQNLRDALKAFGGDVTHDPDDRTPGTGTAAKGGTIGERFTSSAAYQGWLKEIAPNGRIPDQAKGLNSPAVNFGGLKNLFGLKTVITGGNDSSAGAFVRVDYQDIFETLGRRPFVLRQVVANRTTGSDTVEYVRQTARTNAAAMVPEATTAAAIGSGDPAVTTTQAGLKPEGGMTFTKVTETVKTVAEWVPATKRALSDVAQLRGIIDDELSDDIEQKIEDQIISGNGTGENFTGILETSGTQTQAFSTDIFETIRKAITKARVVGRVRPNGVAIHPADDERIDLTRDNENRFYGAGPFSMGPSTVWGLPRVVTEAVPEGTAIVGDWSKAILWDREQTTIQVSDSHADFFVRNLVAVLAEARLAFGVTRPAAFVETDLTA